MSIFVHKVENFPFDKLYKAVQTNLKIDDETFHVILPAIKKKNEPAVKKVLVDHRSSPYKMEAYFEGPGIFVRLIDDKSKQVDKTKTILITDYKTTIMAGKNLLAEHDAAHAAASKVVAARQIKPIEIFHRDFKAEVLQGAGKVTPIPIDDLMIAIRLTDPIVLQHVPNNITDSLLAQKLFEAVNPAEIEKDLTNAYVDACKTIAEKPDNQDAYKKEVASAKAAFQNAVQTVIAKATKRATKPLTELIKISVNQNIFKIEAKVALGTAIAGSAIGVVATGVSLVTAPIHMGVGFLASIAATAQSLKATYHAISDSSKTLDTLRDELNAALQKLQKEYATASSKAIGAEELAKSLANVLVPNIKDDINRIKTLLEMVEKRLVAREVDVHELASTLGHILNGVQDAENQVAEFDKKNKGKTLTKRQQDAYQKFKSALDKDSSTISGLYQKLVVGNTEVPKLKASYAAMRKEVEALASGVPTWAQIGKVVIGTAGAVGFLVGGNIGAPNPNAGMDALNGAAGLVGNVQGALDSTMNLGQGLDDAVGDS